MKIGMLTPRRDKPVPPLTKFQGIVPRPGMLLGRYDFITPSISTVPHNMLAYAAIIGSRIVEARSSEERREVLWRDPFGWYMWFMGNAFMQASLISMSNKQIQPYLSRKMGTSVSRLTQTVGLMFTPNRLYHLTSDTQILERQKQIVDFLKKQPKVSQAAIEQTHQHFKKALNRRTLISFTGLLFTLIALGLGIPLINIVVTKQHVDARNRKRGEALAKAKAKQIAQTQRPQKIGPSHHSRPTQTPFVPRPMKIPGPELVTGFYPIPNRLV